MIPWPDFQMFSYPFLDIRMSSKPSMWRRRFHRLKPGTAFIKR